MCGTDTGAGDDNTPASQTRPTPKPPRPAISKRDRMIKTTADRSKAMAAHWGQIGAVRDDDDDVVRDGSGRPVKAEPLTQQRHHENIHKDDGDLPLNDENLTPEEAEASGRGSARRSFSDRRKSRLTINRTNPSLAIGNKKYRGGVNVT